MEPLKSTKTTYWNLKLDEGVILIRGWFRHGRLSTLLTWIPRKAKAAITLWSDPRPSGNTRATVVLYVESSPGVVDKEESVPLEEKEAGEGRMASLASTQKRDVITCIDKVSRVMIISEKLEHEISQYFSH